MDLGADPLPPPHSPGSDGPHLSVAEVRALGWAACPDWCASGLWRVKGLVRWVVTDPEAPRAAGRKAVVPAWVVEVFNGLDPEQRQFYEPDAVHDGDAMMLELDQVLVMHVAALLLEDAELRASVRALLALGLRDVPRELIRLREPRLVFHGQ